MAIKVLSKAGLSVERPTAGVKTGVNLKEQIRPRQQNGKWVAEFISPEDFGTGWTTRQRYEILAGRDMEPLLYEPIYLSMPNGDYGSSVTINSIGPGGVVFNELVPGGETRFASIGGSSKAIPLKDYTVGLEYSERMFVYNEFFGVEIFERQAGIASNALLNNIHLSPFINATYTGNNLASASALGATLEQKILHTIEAATAIAATDNTTTLLGYANLRRGPYVILCSSSDVFSIERALNGNNVGGGVDMQSSVRSKIQAVIAYDGWVGQMNGIVTTYAGVAAGTCYLIDVNPGTKMTFALSLIKFIMKKLEGNEDVSRLIHQQEILWTSLGVYINVLAIATKVTLPTS